MPFEVEVPLGTSLSAAFGEMLQHDVHWVPVVEDGRYLGVLTPNSLHAAVRRSGAASRSSPATAGSAALSAGANPSPSHHLEGDVDVAPGGVAVRAHLVRVPDHLLRRLGVDTGNAHVELDRDAEGPTVDRAQRHAVR